MAGGIRGLFPINQIRHGKAETLRVRGQLYVFASVYSYTEKAIRGIRGILGLASGRRLESRQER